MKNNKKTVSTTLPKAPQGGGFTMIELLVVMFVITMLLTIGVPAIIKIRTQSKINSCQVTVNIIDKAIEMYHGAHNRYPSVEGMPAELYGQAYASEQQGGAINEIEDYQPGPGYRLQPRGRIYEPWNGVDKLKRSGDYVSGNRVFFQDAFSRSIWYCLFTGEPEAGQKAYHDAEFDRAASEPGISLIDIDDYAKNKQNKYYRRDYILMSQSADGMWGKVRGPDARDDQYAEPTDDIHNFKE
jgi:prepilin-type N-terminal cleavage/methylation domain-containing protein